MHTLLAQLSGDFWNLLEISDYLKPSEEFSNVLKISDKKLQSWLQKIGITWLYTSFSPDFLET